MILIAEEPTVIAGQPFLTEHPPTSAVISIDDVWPVTSSNGRYLSLRRQQAATTCRSASRKPAVGTATNAPEPDGRFMYTVRCGFNPIYACCM
jgi:hypothetical protein